MFVLITACWLRLTIYGLNRGSRKLFDISVSWLKLILRNHLNDYLGAVVFAAYFNLLLSLAGRPRVERLPFFLALGLLCSAAWELLAPLVLTYSTADWIDCIAYFLGFLTYWLLNCVRQRDVLSSLHTHRPGSNKD